MAWLFRLIDAGYRFLTRRNNAQLSTSRYRSRRGHNKRHPRGADDDRQLPARTRSHPVYRRQHQLERFPWQGEHAVLFLLKQMRLASIHDTEDESVGDRRGPTLNAAPNRARARCYSPIVQLGRKTINGLTLEWTPKCTQSPSGWEGLGGMPPRP